MACYAKLETLRNEVRATFGKTNIYEYTVAWGSEGIADSSSEHVEYVKKFGEDFKRAIIDKVETALRLEPLPHPHTVEVLAHGFTCFARNNIFRGRATIVSKIERYFRGAFDTPTARETPKRIRATSSSSDLIADSDFSYDDEYSEDDLEFSEEEIELNKKPQLRRTVSQFPAITPRKNSTTTPRRTSQHCSFIVHGNSGYGKTSIMAKAAYTARGLLGPKAIVIVRFCGTTPNSSTTFRLVESICVHLQAIYPNTNLTIPSEYREILKVFPSWLGLATYERPIVLFVDSLDQLNDEFAAELRWFPNDLPENVYIVASTIGDCPAFRELERRRSAIPSTFLEVGELKSTEVAPIVDSWLAHDCKRLQQNQRQMLDGVANFGLNPLFLRLLYNRASNWKSFDREEPLENSVADLIKLFLARLEIYHGTLFVTHVFGLLAASKYGLATDEILDMISAQDNVLGAIFQYHQAPQQRVPSLLLARLKMDCGEYMVEKSSNGTSVLGWYHIQFWKITQERYFTRLRSGEYFSQIIAKYYLGELALLPDRGISPQPTWFESANGRKLNLRKLTELPTALINGKMGPEAISVLTDLNFIEAICSAGLIRELISYYHQAIDAFAVQYDSQLRLRKFLQFLKSEGDVLGHYPHLTIQIAANAPDTHIIAQSAKQILAASPTAYSEWVDKSVVNVCEMTLKGHLQPVVFCCFAGKTTILTCSEDKTIRVWSLITGKQIICYKGHREIPTCCDVYGNTVASADKYRLHIWIIDTGVTIARRNLLLGRFNRVTRLCKFASDGQRLVTTTGTTLWPGNPPGAVIVWNAVTWKRIGIPLAFSLDRSVVALSADCRLALVRHIGNNTDTFPRLGCDKIELWDISVSPEEEDDESVQPTYEVRENQVVKIVSGRVIPVQYYEHKGIFLIPFKYLRKGDVRCKQTWPSTEKVSFHGNDVYVQPMHGNFPFGIQNATFSANRSKQLGWYKNTCYLWHFQTRSSPNMYYRRLSAHSADINYAAFSPDESYVATVSSDCTCRIWPAQDPSTKPAIGTFDGKIRTRAHFINDNSVIVIQENVLEIHVWMEGMRRFQSTHILYIKIHAANLDGNFVVTVGGVDDTLCLWDVKTGNELQVIVPPHKISCIAFSRDFVIAGTFTCHVLIWELSNTRQLFPKPSFELPQVDGEEDSTSFLTISHDDKLLAIATLKGILYLVKKIASNQVVFNEISKGHTTTLTRMQFSPDGKFLAYGNACGYVWLCNMQNLEQKYTSRCFINAINGITFTEDSTLVIVCSNEEKRIRVINVNTAQAVVDYWITVPYQITAIAVNSRGRRIVFDRNGKKYHSIMHGMHLFTPQSILPLDLNIKSKWYPGLARREWFQLNADNKVQEHADATIWVSSADNLVKTERNTWCQGSVLTLSAYLPAFEYEAQFHLRLPSHSTVAISFSVEGAFVYSTTFVWDTEAQAHESQDTDLVIGRFIVAQPCMVTFKMQSQDKERSAEYRVSSIKVRIVEDKAKTPKPETDQKFVFSLNGYVEFFHQGLRMAGTLVQAHGDKLLVELIDEDREKYQSRIVVPRQAVVSVVPRIPDHVKVTEDGISVLISQGKEWFEAKLYEKTESAYLISIDGGEKVKYSIVSTDVMDNITPNPSDIKVLDTVLCKVDQQWLEAVVVEMYEGDVTTLSDNLFRLHVQDGSEKVVGVRGLRAMTGNKARTLATLDTQFLMMQGLKDILNSGSSTEDLHAQAESPNTSSSSNNVSREQLEHTIEQLFHHVDADDSGELSYEEVQTLSNSMGLFLNKAAWQSVFKKMDTDGNGSISKEELVNFWTKWYTEKGPGARLKKARVNIRKSAKF
eukprot:Phypoly_transcript_00209.p1 GENE.Phypoly_transcript_00209~~Phypoly_transcript_00209.p1  ORF type:complete len:1974 (+),score=215.33 Phypoly_transcript_00209:431-5923(+)